MTKPRNTALHARKCLELVLLCSEDLPLTKQIKSHSEACECITPELIKPMQVHVASVISEYRLCSHSHYGDFVYKVSSTFLKSVVMHCMVRDILKLLNMLEKYLDQVSPSLIQITVNFLTEACSESRFVICQIKLNCHSHRLDTQLVLKQKMIWATNFCKVKILPFLRLLLSLHLS